MQVTKDRWTELGSLCTEKIIKRSGFTGTLAHGQPTVSCYSEGDCGPARWWHSQGVPEAPDFWLHAGELGWVGLTRSVSYGGIGQYHSGSANFVQNALGSRHFTNSRPLST